MSDYTGNPGRPVIETRDGHLCLQFRDDTDPLGMAVAAGAVGVGDSIAAYLDDQHRVAFRIVDPDVGQ